MPRGKTIFPFHFSRSTYATDRHIEKTVLIEEDRLDDPLRGIDGGFDLIVVQEVFEHLHSPAHIARYLTERLPRGGLLFFDYARTGAKGQDSPAGLAEREETLGFLNESYRPLIGSLTASDEDPPPTIARKV